MQLENFKNAVLAAILQMSLLEVVAVILSILYLVWAARENVWCWYAAGASVIIYGYIFWEAKLYGETVLQVFYLAMAVYGFWLWKKGADSSERPISSWTIRHHTLFIGAGTIATLLFGLLLDVRTDSALPYLDSFTTIFAMITTWMVTQKILENWLYWIIVDGVSIYLYVSRELYLTAVLFFAYVIIVIFGYFEWLKLYRRQSPT